MVKQAQKNLLLQQLQQKQANTITTNFFCETK